MDLKGRHFLKLLDFTPAEIAHLLRLAAELKQARRAGSERQQLTGKNIALIFEKASTRTRCAFEVAAYDQGARVTYLDPTGSQLGKKESIRDTARVLGRMYHGIEYRGFEQSRVEDLARHAGVPVWNGLTNEFHPTQALADVLTMQEHAGKPLQQVAFAFLGDGRNNVANSLLVVAAKLGMDCRIVAPPELQPNPELVGPRSGSRRRPGPGSRSAPTSPRGSRAAISSTPMSGCRWASPMPSGQERIRLLKPYQVNRAAMEKTGNPQVKFLHCLPAFHDRADGNRRSHFQEIRPGGHGGDRRGLRVPGLDRLRPGRKPPAHHQGRDGGDTRRLAPQGSRMTMQKPLILIALGGNALIQKGQQRNGRGAVREPQGPDAADRAPVAQPPHRDHPRQRAPGGQPAPAAGELRRGARTCRWRSSSP